MSWPAILLIVISAAMHAGWNLVSKRERPSGAFFLIGTTAGALAMLPIVVSSWPQVVTFSGQLWVMLVLTGLFQAVYFAGLAASYRRGEMSVVYPLARSLPVVMVALLSVVLRGIDAISLLCALGVGLIVTGCAMLPLRELRFREIRSSFRGVIPFVLVTAIGTTGYSVIDDAGLRVMRGDGPGQGGMPAWHAAVLYLALQAASTSAWLGAIVGVPSLLRRPEAADGHRLSLKWSVLTGLVAYLTYGMVLWAMAYAQDVSYIVAFRQLSVPLGAIMGVVILGEQAPWSKVVGVAFAFVGLVLVALG